MTNILDLLIPVVNAQTLDSVSQPTFGPIEVGTQNGVVSTVLLSSTSTATQVGQKFKVTVEIKTNAQLITEYQIVIDFDSSKLSVVDQDTTVQGTQIKLLDQVFTISNPQVNNIVSSTGRVFLVANIPSGTPISVNRNVAEIEFQAQQIGAASIKIVQGSTGTRLTRSNGTTLTYTPNELSVQISATQSNNNNQNTGNQNTGNTGVDTNTGNATQVPVVIPNTGIEDFQSLIPVLIGILLIVLGVMLSKTSTKKKSLES